MKPALTPEEVENINQLVKNRPDITMQEIIETLHLKMVDLESVSIFPEAHSLRRMVDLEGVSIFPEAHSLRRMVDLKSLPILPEAHSLRRTDKILLGLILTVQFDQDFLQISCIS